MNILPKKRWHVRTKDNIARVRRDEAAAAKELQEVERRSKLADQEARTKYLREKAKLKYGGFEGGSSGAAAEADQAEESVKKPVVMHDQAGHVNFFAHLEEGETTANTNKEHEEEKKKEQEDYEKKIGLLTYLGQDTQELTGEKSWWQTVDRGGGGEGTCAAGPSSKQEKLLDLNDPMKDVRDYMGCKGVQRILEKEDKKRKRSDSSPDSSSPHRKRRRKTEKKSKSKKSPKSKKSKKDKKSKKKKKRHRRRSSSEEDDSSPEEENADDKRLKLEALRAERQSREKRERIRTDKLLYGKSDLEPKKKKVGDMTDKEQVETQRKYNNQFNPQHAKQNRLDANKKYWLEH